MVLQIEIYNAYKTLFSTSGYLSYYLQMKAWRQIPLRGVRGAAGVGVDLLKKSTKNQQTILHHIKKSTETIQQFTRTARVAFSVNALWVLALIMEVKS